MASPSVKIAAKKWGAKISNTLKITINTMPTILSPRLIIAFLSGTGSKIFGVHLADGIFRSSDRLSTDHFSAFFISIWIFFRSIMAKVKVTAPKADMQDSIASVIPTIKPSTIARIITEAAFCEVIAGISPIAFISEIIKIGTAAQIKTTFTNHK